jgi:uncharacterized protein (DUF305 family)
MSARFLAAVTAATILAGAPALGQENRSGQVRFELPEPCRAAADVSSDMMKQMETMQDRMGQLKQEMQAMMKDMSEAQKQLHQAMMNMDRPMTMGMMAKDADVAWICAMIPHHQGAIAMARAGLEQADNSESKKLARETIEENEKGLKKLVDWVEKHATRESRDEKAGNPSQKQ